MSAVLSKSGPGTESIRIGAGKTKEERKEAKFWTGRRSLRLWPIKEQSCEEVQRYLTDRLKMNADYVDNVGEVSRLSLIHI